MASRKPSARARQADAFMSQLGGMDDVFAREDARRAQDAERRDAARRHQACERKKRYGSRVEAEDARAACAEHGARGLSIYRCPYCEGWHLTHRDKKGT